MDIKIRKLLPNESNSYRVLRLECLKNYPKNFTSNYQDEKAKPKLLFQPYIETSDLNNFVIGAFQNNNLVGICGFNRHERTKVNHSGIIIQVYVNPEYQGNSIGLNIVKSTLDEAFKINGIEQIEIDVITVNKNAAKIYEKIGFETYGIQNNFLKIDDSYYDHKMMMIFKNQV
ncbi:GNAT family N-acetyltransferase [Psychroserpens sp.]